MLLTEGSSANTRKVERADVSAPAEATPASRTVHHPLQGVRLAKLARHARITVAWDLLAPWVLTLLRAHLLTRRKRAWEVCACAKKVTLMGRINVKDNVYLRVRIM